MLKQFAFIVLLAASACCQDNHDPKPTSYPDLAGEWIINSGVNATFSIVLYDQTYVVDNVGTIEGHAIDTKKAIVFSSAPGYITGLYLLSAADDVSVNLYDVEYNAAHTEILSGEGTYVVADSVRSLENVKIVRR